MLAGITTLRRGGGAAGSWLIDGLHSGTLIGVQGEDVLMLIPKLWVFVVFSCVYANWLYSVLLLWHKITHSNCGSF